MRNTSIRVQLPIANIYQWVCSQYVTSEKNSKRPDFFPNGQKDSSLFTPIVRFPSSTFRNIYPTTRSKKRENFPTPDDNFASSSFFRHCLSQNSHTFIFPFFRQDRNLDIFGELIGCCEFFRQVLLYFGVCNTGGRKFFTIFLFLCSGSLESPS